MSTRSGVAVEREDGTFSHIFCHWDGYPSHNGRILREHYTDRAKVEQLLNLGSISILAEEIGEKQDSAEFNTHPREHPEWCKSYHRDRGEDLERDEFGSFAELLNAFEDGWQCYMYIFCLDEKWRYFEKYPKGERSIPKSIGELAELTGEVCTD